MRCVHPNIRTFRQQKPRRRLLISRAELCLLLLLMSQPCKSQGVVVSALPCLLLLMMSQPCNPTDEETTPWLLLPEFPNSETQPKEKNAKKKTRVSPVFVMIYKIMLNPTQPVTYVAR